MKGNDTIKKNKLRCVLTEKAKDAIKKTDTKKKIVAHSSLTEEVTNVIRKDNTKKKIVARDKLTEQVTTAIRKDDTKKKINQKSLKTPLEEQTQSLTESRSNQKQEIPAFIRDHERDPKKARELLYAMMKKSEGKIFIQ